VPVVTVLCYHEANPAASAVADGDMGRHLRYQILDLLRTGREALNARGARG
jgi:hypothetical protein